MWNYNHFCWKFNGRTANIIISEIILKICYPQIQPHNTFSLMLLTDNLRYNQVLQNFLHISQVILLSITAGDSHHCSDELLKEESWTLMNWFRRLMDVHHRLMHSWYSPSSTRQLQESLQRKLERTELKMGRNTIYFFCIPHYSEYASVLFSPHR